MTDEILDPKALILSGDCVFHCLNARACDEDLPRGCLGFLSQHPQPPAPNSPLCKDARPLFPDQDPSTVTCGLCTKSHFCELPKARERRPKFKPILLPVPTSLSLDLISPPPPSADINHPVRGHLLA